MKRWLRAMAMASLSGGSMLVLTVAYHGEIGPQGLRALLLECLFFSIPFALWGWLPQTDSCETQISQGYVPSSFVVKPTRGWMIATTIFSLSMTAIFGWAIVGLFGGWSEGTSIFYLSILALSLWCVISSLSFARFRTVVSPDAVRIRRLFSEVAVERGQIVRFEPAHYAWCLYPLVTGKPYLLSWLDDRKKPRKLVVGLDGAALENKWHLLNALASKDDLQQRHRDQWHNAV